VHISTRTLRPPQTTILMMIMGVVLSLAAASCGGGVRPTITTDALQETGGAADVAATPTVPAAQITADVVPAATPTPADAATGAPAEPLPTDDVEQLVVEVIASYPHDPAAFTQGLELDDGLLIESTGQFGASDLRRTQVETGEVVEIVSNRADFFAEGLTKVGDEFVQLTWQNNTALYWDATTFELNRQVSYAGEGWGLCYDGQFLVMTDGSSELTLRDPATFDEIARVPVTFKGEPIDRLNELECADGAVWANVWLTDQIVRIDPATGTVNASVDASSIRFETENNDAVLNGIAYDPSDGSFLITGKLWPTLYRVNFVPQAG